MVVDTAIMRVKSVPFDDDDFDALFFSDNLIREKPKRSDIRPSLTVTVRDYCGEFQYLLFCDEVIFKVYFNCDCQCHASIYGHDL